MCKLVVYYANNNFWAWKGEVDLTKFDFCHVNTGTKYSDRKTRHQNEVFTVNAGSIGLELGGG